MAGSALVFVLLASLLRNIRIVVKRHAEINPAARMAIVGSRVRWGRCNNVVAWVEDRISGRVQAWTN